MNLMAKYLKHLESNSDGEWFTGEVNIHSEECFRCDPSDKAITSGVWYSRPFMINGNAILLMDTQGLFHGYNGDKKIGQDIYALSSLLSSYQILNVRSQIDENTLEAIHNLDDAVKEINSESREPVKTPQLEILVRDVSYFRWHYNDAPAKYTYETWKNKMNDVGAQTFDDPQYRNPEQNKMRDDIKEMHSNMKYFGLVHPGTGLVNNVSEKVELNTDVENDFKVLTKDFIEKYVGNIKTDIEELQENERVTPHVFERRVREFTNICNVSEGLAGKLAKARAKASKAEARARFWKNTKENVETFLVLLFAVTSGYIWRCQFNDICLPYSNQAYAAQASVVVYFILRFIYLFVISGLSVMYNISHFISTTVSWPFRHPLKFSLAILGALAYFFLPFKIM
jgi:uncharacterized membrane protein